MNCKNVQPEGKGPCIGNGATPGMRVEISKRKIISSLTVGLLSLSNFLITPVTTHWIRVCTIDAVATSYQRTKWLGNANAARIHAILASASNLASSGLNPGRIVRFMFQWVRVTYANQIRTWTILSRFTSVMRLLHWFHFHDDPSKLMLSIKEVTFLVTIRTGDTTHLKSGLYNNLPNKVWRFPNVLVT